MKNMMFLIFFSIVTTIYFLGCWYLFSRGNQALLGQSYRNIFRWTFWLLAISFLAGQFLERANPMLITKIITLIGSLWLIILCYAIIMVVFIDLIRLSNHFIHYIPQTFAAQYLTGPRLFAGVLSVALLLLISGYINAAFPRVNNIEVNVQKPNPGYTELKVAVVSDIHMGFIVGNRKVKRLVNKLEKLNPDLIVFAGDLVDHNPLPVIKYDMGQHFKRLQPPLGILAVTGNHEYIGHPEVSINYLSQFGIQYIRDSVVQVDGNILFVGRDDRDKGRFTGKPRKTIEELLKGADKSKFIIMADHQPVEYNEAAEQGIDFMVSGHTHSGQIWPFNYITHKVFMNDNGHMQIGKTHFYVSPGYGTWGPPVRIGNRPEIALITLKFN